MARAAVDALGITDGPTYTQIRIGSNGPQVIEVAARLGGGHDAELCEAVLGVDLNGLALSAALGEAIDPRRLRPGKGAGGGCVRFLVAPEGELAGVRGLDDAEAVEGVTLGARLQAARPRVRAAADRARPRGCPAGRRPQP